MALIVAAVRAEAREDGGGPLDEATWRSLRHHPDDGPRRGRSATTASRW